MALQFQIFRTDHQLWPDVFIKVLFAQSSQFHGALLEGETLFVRILCYFGSSVVPNHGVQARNKHETV